MNLIETIKFNRDKRLNGEIITIPWPFNKLNNVIAGIQKERYYLVSGGPKSGKTQIADSLFTYNVIDWYLANKGKTNIKPKIFYFTLELTSEYKQLMLISRKLFKDYKKIINPEKLMSSYKDFIIDEETTYQIENIYNTYVTEVLKFTEFIEDAKTPKSIYKIIMNYIENSGKIYKKLITTKTGEEIEIFDRYEPMDENEFVFVIVDHIGLITPEKGETLYQAIADLSSMLSRLRNHYKIIPVIVQQQALEIERQQFTYKGESIIDKLKPSAAGLADNKCTSRDCDILFGIFSPDKFDIEVYKKYEIYKLKDCFKELSISINRHGKSNLSLPLFFIGDSNNFEELPPADSLDIIKVYKFAKDIENLQLNIKSITN